MDHEALVWFFDRFLLVYLAGVILLVGLLLGWGTALGRAMARYKIVLAGLFLGAAASEWVSYFLGEQWRWLLRVGLTITLTGVVWQFRRRFGSWRAMHRHAMHNLRHIRELIIWHRNGDGGDRL